MDFDPTNIYGAAEPSVFALSGDPFLGYPPWAIAREAPPARIVGAARGYEASAARCLERGDHLSARGCQKFADALWVGAIVAIMQGRA